MPSNKSASSSTGLPSHGALGRQKLCASALARVQVSVAFVPRIWIGILLALHHTWARAFAPRHAETGPAASQAYRTSVVHRRHSSSELFDPGLHSSCIRWIESSQAAFVLASSAVAAGDKAAESTKVIAASFIGSGLRDTTTTSRNSTRRGWSYAASATPLGLRPTSGADRAGL
jgi:hypothetical protein